MSMRKKFSGAHCLLDGQLWLGSKGENLKNSVPRWQQKAILGLFLAGQEYFKG